MANFTELEDSHIGDLAGRFGLGAVRSWRSIEAGTINSNYVLECETGRFFLRVNENKSEDDVRYESELVSQLAALGVPTPPPVFAGGCPYAAFGDRWISVFPWVPGRHVERSEVSAGLAAEVGGALAALHQAADQVHGLEERYGIYTTRKIAERARGFRDSNDEGLTEVNELIADEIRWLMAQPEPRDQGIIHGDLFRDNVLFDRDSDRLVALLDFEQASLGSRIYDLAVCVNAWCFDEQLAPKLVAAMVRAYDDRRSPVDRRALWAELRRAAWRFTVTRITDVYLPGVDLPDKDFRRYARRLKAWRELGSDGLTDWLGVRNS